MRSMFSFCFSLTHLSHRMINKENQRFWDRTVITRLDLNGLGGGGGGKFKAPRWKGKLGGENQRAQKKKGV